MKNLYFCCFALLLCGCTWVKLTNGGAGVQVANMTEVSECRRIGKTRSITKASIGGVSRNSEKVDDETTTIARNEAAHMGGNTIVIGDELTAGEREFLVFSCSD
jgi:hypothetical protein